jgi:hypothetical protein
MGLAAAAGSAIAAVAGGIADAAAAVGSALGIGGAAAGIGAGGWAGGLTAADLAGTAAAAGAGAAGAGALGAGIGAGGWAGGLSAADLAGTAAGVGGGGALSAAAPVFEGIVGGAAPTTDALGAGALEAAGNWGATEAGTAAGGILSGGLGPASIAPTLAASQAGNGGLLGSIGSILGGKTGGISNLGLLLGGVNALNSFINKPTQPNFSLSPASQAAIAANQGPYYNQPLNTSAPGRTPITPNLTPGNVTPAPGVAPSQQVNPWYSYGALPEQSFFSGNSLQSYGWPAARGGALSQIVARGQVRGPGDGNDDRVPAALSDGEYVMDAPTVARIGGGSNNAGAKKLDAFREWLARETGQKKFVPRKVSGGALEHLARHVR